MTSSSAQSLAGRLGNVGIWSRRLRGRDPQVAVDHAIELDRLGYRALWVPGGIGGPLFSDVDALLAATPTMIVATAVLNTWMHDPYDTAAWVAQVRSQHPERLLLGLGASHRAAVETTGQKFIKPLSAVSTYIDRLEGATAPVRREEMLVAALGPKMLQLAGTRTAGTHTFLVTPDHSAVARHILGPRALVIPELKVVLETRAERAREIARHHLLPYLRLPNYTNNLVRLGFCAEDFVDGGSDRLIDAIVAWGPARAVSERVNAHLDAGADHVCLHVIDDGDANRLRDGWQELAQLIAS